MSLYWQCWKVCKVALGKVLFELQPERRVTSISNPTFKRLAKRLSIIYTLYKIQFNLIYDA